MMVHKFKRRVVLFPVNWANSVVDWISGICSPKGTIIVKNSLSTSDEGSLELDVDIVAVTKLVRDRIIAERKAESRGETSIEIESNDEGDEDDDDE